MAQKTNSTNTPMKPEQFEKSYLDSKMWILLLAILMIVIGTLIYLEVCGAISSGSNPSSFVGASAQSSENENGEVSGAIIAFAETLGVVIVIIGVVLLVGNVTRNGDAHKLAKDGDYVGAVSLTPAKGKTPYDKAIFLPQMSKWNTKLANDGTEPNSLLPADLQAKYKTTDDSDETDVPYQPALKAPYGQTGQMQYPGMNAMPAMPTQRANIFNTP